MLTRIASLLTVAAAAAALTAGPAGAQSPTDNPAPGATPGACVDHVRPTARFTAKAARRAGRRHVLRGTARDSGCGVDRVQVSVARKVGRRCVQLSRRHRLTRPRNCARRVWLQAKGSSRWSFRLPKHLKTGRYVVRTRAVDFAGNVQRPRRRRVTIR